MFSSETNVQGGSEFFKFRIAITLFAREQSPLPVAVSQIGTKAGGRPACHFGFLDRPP
jgi:hypothetical protein